MTRWTWRNRAAALWPNGIMLLITLAAFVIRIWQLEAKSIWWDESLTLYRARETLSFIITNRIEFPGMATIDLHPPVYFLLMHFVLRLFGESDFALRFSSVIFGAALVPLLYLVGKQMWNERSGIFAALLAALAPLHLWYAQEARMYTEVTFLGLFSVYALWRAIGSGRRVWYAVYIIATAAMLYSHYFSFLIMAFEALLVLALLWRERRWHIEPTIVVIAVLAALVALPLVPYALWRLGIGPETGRWFIPLFDILRDSLNSFSLGISVELSDGWPMLIDLAFLAVFLIGLVPWGETRRPAIDKTLFLLGYLFVPIAGIYIASLVKPVYMGSRYLIMVSPAYYLALGVGLDTIAKRSRLVSALSLVVLVAGMLISDYNYFFDARYRTKEDYRDAARYIETHEWPDDVIVVDAPENITAFTHYYRGTLPIIGLPKVALWGNKDKKWSDLETFYVARKHSRVWLVLCRTMFSDPDELVRKWLDQYAFKINEVVFPSYGSPVMLGLYTYNSKYPKYKQPILNTPTTLPADAVNFENQLTLVSYQLVKSDVPAGERALVTINWLPQVDRLLDYKISLRLVDGEGHSWGQVDQMPFNFYFPTSQWPKSKVVREGYDLPIRLGTPPGSYRLQVEVYQPTTLRGLEVIDANGIRHGTKATLGSVVVTRPDVPPSPDTLAIQHRTDARWGDVIQLLGYDLASEEVKPGDTLALMLTYRVLHRPNTDLGLHLQLVNDQGREVAGRDFALTSPYPVSSWAAGDVLVGQYGLVVPAATPGGRYRLRAVLYDPATSRALDAHQPGWWPLGGGAIDLASIAVLGREVHTEVPPIQHLLRATIDGKVELLGYDLDASEAKPGGSVRLTVHWRALAAMDTSYTVFAHLVGPDGKIWGQKDSVPVDGTRPTTGWLTGEVIADRYEIPLRADAPPGDYVLEVGLYDAATGARLQAVDASGQRLLDDRIILTQIHVAP